MTFAPRCLCQFRARCANIHLYKGQISIIFALGDARVVQWVCTPKSGVRGNGRVALRHPLWRGAMRLSCQARASSTSRPGVNGRPTGRPEAFAKLSSDFFAASRKQQEQYSDNIEGFYAFMLYFCFLSWVAFVS